MTQEKEFNSAKISYFIDYWLDATHVNNSIESELIHSIVYNPKELIEEFIAEIQRNQLSNQDNKKFFEESFRKFAKLKVRSLGCSKSTINLILIHLGKKDSHEYLSHLLNMALTELRDFSLAKQSIAELSSHLTDDSEIDQSKIKHLVNLIIFELMHKKYSHKKIANTPLNIFSGYDLVDGVFQTDFPLPFKSDVQDISSADYQEYIRKASGFIDSLNELGRLNAIENLFECSPEDFTYIFKVKGLVGEVDFSIGNVRFYDPKKTKLVKDEYVSTIKINENFNAENESYCNVAITISVVDIEAGKDVAIKVLEDKLDLVVSRYTNYKVPLSVSFLKYIVIDNEGSVRSIFNSNNLDDMHSIKLDNSKFQEKIFSREINMGNLSNVNRKIFESMHWKRKAIESNDPNEKILWFWVALENIFEQKNFSTAKTVFDTTAKILVMNFIYQYAWMHHNKLSSMEGVFGEFSHYRSSLQLPNELVSELQLKPKDGDVIELEKLINNIGRVQAYLAPKSLLFEQLDNLNELFSDGKKMVKFIEELKEIFSDKLIYLYRIRNKIVHNAHNEFTPMTNYYADFGAIASALSINRFTSCISKHSLNTTNEVVNHIHYDFDKLLLDLKVEGSKTLL